MNKTIVFIGNPNVGKSSWINVLSNANLKVGNYAGVTVAYKEAEVTWDHQRLLLVDLPGIYDLQAPASEERIAAKYLQEHDVDVLVNVVDATNLERQLWLTWQCRELQIPMLVLCNYKDEAEKLGIHIDLLRLQQCLQVKTILCSALDKKDVSAVKNGIQELLHVDKTVIRHALFLPQREEQLVHTAVSFIQAMQTTYLFRTPAQVLLYALRWCQQDALYVAEIEKHHPNAAYGYAIAEEFASFSGSAHRQALIASCMKSVSHVGRSRMTISRKLDTILLHRYFALPCFIFICLAGFALVFRISQPLTAWLDQFFQEYLSYYLGQGISFLPSFWQTLLLQVVRGVGSVLSFTPLFACFYFLFAWLEECGYFARVAFLFDRLMRPFGISGKAFIALILGFGCNVPALYATRTLEDQRSKVITALLIPFMSCSARLPVYLLFAAAFSPKKAPIVLTSLYAMGIWVALVLALLLKKILPLRSNRLFTLELPPYHWPSGAILYQQVKRELSAFVRKTLTVVCSAMIILALLTYDAGSMDHSPYMKGVNVIAPIFEPLGFGNRPELIAALPGAVIAKENVVGFLGQMFRPHAKQPLYRSFSYDTKLQIVQLLDAVMLKQPVSEQSFHAQLGQLGTDELSPVRAYSYLVFILMTIPCVMTMYQMYREFGVRMVLCSVGVMLLVPYIASFVLFQIGKLLFLSFL